MPFILLRNHKNQQTHGIVAFNELCRGTVPWHKSSDVRSCHKGMLFINKGMLFINKGMLFVNTELLFFTADLLFVTAGIKRIPTLGLKDSHPGTKTFPRWGKRKIHLIRLGNYC